MAMSPRAVQMQGTEALTTIVRHVEAHPNVHAIECLFLSDTDGSGALDSEEFAGAVQHMGLDMPVEQTDIAFAAMCLEGKDEINIEQFISFQQQFRRAREREAYSSNAESLVARSLFSLPTNERLTVIEEMGQKAWDQARTKMENAEYGGADGADGDEADEVEVARRRAAVEAAAADQAQDAFYQEELEAQEAEDMFAK
eukprot:SAG22_NODE_7392_length_744_cov_0.956589_1_plen_198_part_10